MKRTGRTRPEQDWDYTDVAESSITVTDIKHYFYCPQIVYYEKVLHAAPKFTSQQKESTEEHQRLESREKRRKAALFYSKEYLEAEKTFKLHLYSQKLRLEGALDLLIKRGREYIPVDYKRMHSDSGKPWTDHKYQLTAYALLTEEKHNTTIRRGYLYYIPEEKVIELEITQNMKEYLKKTINKIHNIIQQEQKPETKTAPQKCTGGCGYKWICK